MVLLDIFGNILQHFYFGCLDGIVEYAMMLVKFPVHTGNFSSYLVPAAALGAMGYCYFWWKARFLMLKVKTISYPKCRWYCTC